MLMEELIKLEKCIIQKVLLSLLVLLIVSTNVNLVQAQAEEDYNWIEGGQTVSLNHLAEIDEKVFFLDEMDTKRLEDEISKSSGFEIGSVFPEDEEEYWFVVFEYEEVGYIKDNEKDKIDQKAILESYIEGTEELNKERAPEEALTVDGWLVEPFYDENTHNLTWALLGHNARGEKFVNLNVRLLTRQGFISATLVTGPEDSEADKKKFEEFILPNLHIKEGHRYEDFDEKTDALSEYGLSGLILGGAGIVLAKKTGLLALLLVFIKKGGYLVIAGIIAVGGYLLRIFRRKKVDDDEMNDVDETTTIDSSTGTDSNPERRE